MSPKSITQRPDDNLADDDETEDDDELSLSEEEETEDEGASPPHSAVSSLSPSLPPPPAVKPKPNTKPEPQKQVPKPVARYSEGGVNGVGKLQVTIRRGRMKESSTAEDLYIKFRQAAAGVWHIGERWWQVRRRQVQNQRSDRQLEPCLESTVCLITEDIAERLLLTN